MPAARGAGASRRQARRPGPCKARPPAQAKGRRVMMFLFAHKRRCTRRRDPRLSALLGLFSAMMMLGAALLERHGGTGDPRILAGIAIAVLVGLALARAVAL